MRTFSFILFNLFVSCAAWGQVKEMQEIQERTPDSTSKKKACKKGKKLFVDTETHFIEYDFQSGNYSKPLQRIQVHTPVIFKIKNINPFAYHVKITPQDSVQNDLFTYREYLHLLSEVQEKQLERAVSEAEVKGSGQTQNRAVDSSEIKNTAQKGQIKQGLTAITTINTLTEKNSSIISDLNRLTETFLITHESDTSLDKLSNIRYITADNIDSVNRLVQNIDLSTSKTDSLEHEYKELKRAFEAKNKEYKENTKTIDTSKKNLSESLKAFHELYNDFFSKYEDFLNDTRYTFKVLRLGREINSVADVPNLTYAVFSKKHAFKATSYLGSLEMQKSITEYKIKFSNLMDAYYKLLYTSTLDEVLEPSGVRKMMDYPQYLWRKAELLNERLNAYPLENILKETLMTIHTLSDSLSYERNSHPIQPEGDLVLFEVKIKRQNPLARNAFYKEMEFTYNQPVYGGIRFDLSLGLAASIFFNTSSYTLNDSSKIVSTKDKHLVSPTLVGLFSASWRKTGYLSYGISMGMGLGTNAGRIELSNFFAGPSILFGRRERFLISSGISFKNVGELRDGFKNKVVPPSSDLSSFMRDKYAFGVFVSATYGLTKKSIGTLKSLK